jgi:hypothetical protein
VSLQYLRLQVAAEAAYRQTAAAEAQLHARAVRERATAAATVTATATAAETGVAAVAREHTAAWERREAWQQPYWRELQSALLRAEAEAEAAGLEAAIAFADADIDAASADADADAVAADGLHRRRRSADDALASARHVNEVYHEVRPGLEQAEELLLSV